MVFVFSLPTLTVENNFSFGKISATSNYQNDIYSVKLKLQHPIPEYLPIRGKKAKIYYHGMLPFCSACHVIGHLTVDCENEPSSWWDYIERLKGCDIPIDFFGTWITQAAAHSSTPKSKSDEIKAQFLTFFHEFVQNPNSVNEQSAATPPNTTQKSRFEALFVATPKLKKQTVDPANQKSKVPKGSTKKAKGTKTDNQQVAEKSENPRGGRPFRGGRSGYRGGRGGRQGRGGRGGRGRGSITA
jgi:hypothetical protein